MRWGQIEEDDDPVEPGQQHCLRCGAFLPLAPNQHWLQGIPRDYEVSYDAEGNVTAFTVKTEEAVPMHGWKCKRCGYVEHEGERA